MEKWNGIMKVLELEHVGRDGNILHREENLLNIIHAQGEDLILKILFAGQAVPENYYLGLDFRSVLDRTQTIGDLFGWEPTTNAYTRQTVKSDNFSVTTMSSGRQANSPTILFRASGGSWGAGQEHLPKHGPRIRHEQHPHILGATQYLHNGRGRGGRHNANGHGPV